MNPWSEDILLIRYTELADNAEKRLNLLIMISQLLNKPANFYTQEHLNLSHEDWKLLCDWIKQGNSSYFWHMESHDIQILHECEKHVILDTHQLLIDIAIVFGRYCSSPQATIDEIWTATRQYVTAGAKLELE